MQTKTLASGQRPRHGVEAFGGATLCGRRVTIGMLTDLNGGGPLTCRSCIKVWELRHGRPYPPDLHKPGRRIP